MKKYINEMLTAFILFAALAVMSSCKDDDSTEIVNKPAVQTFSPIPNESGSIQVFEGDEITITGINLNYVSKVTFGELEARITQQEIKSLTVIMPLTEFTPQDNPHYTDISVYWEVGNERIYYNDFYISVPITYPIVASTEAGDLPTVGSVATMTGRNLDAVTAVIFNGETIAAADFESQAPGELKFKIPVSGYNAGINEVSMSVKWSGGNDITVGHTVEVYTPDVTAKTPQGPGEAIEIGDEIEFEVAFAELIDQVFIGTYSAPVLSDEDQLSAGILIIKVPSAIVEQSPAVAKFDITATYGEPAQTMVLWADVNVDTSPLPIVPPSMTSMTAQDGGADNKFFLLKEVTVRGGNLHLVESVKIGGLNARIQDGASEVEMVFIVPEDFVFDTATDVDVKVTYNGGDEADFGTVKVYPFYYWPGLKLGLNSSSVGNQTDFAANNSILDLATGRVISGAEWFENSFDPFALAATDRNVYTSANNLNQSAITMDEYNSVRPYLFLTGSGGHELSWISTSNSNAQLKSVRYHDGTSYKSVTEGKFGTPLISFRVIDTRAEAAQIKTGEFDDITFGFPTFANAGAPKYKDSWDVGSVIQVDYSTYTKGGRPTAVDEVRSHGYLIINDVVGTSGNLIDDYNSYVSFDCYWSRNLNNDK